MSEGTEIILGDVRVVSNQKDPIAQVSTQSTQVVVEIREDDSHEDDCDSHNNGNANGGTGQSQKEALSPDPMDTQASLNTITNEDLKEAANDLDLHMEDHMEDGAEEEEDAGTEEDGHHEDYQDDLEEGDGQPDVPLSQEGVVLEDSKISLAHEAKLSVVNGRGLWNSWTRNFSSPLLAFLDLLDNAIDASAGSGRCYVSADVDRRDDDQTTGVTIFNTSRLPIKPLNQVLEVYTSCKGRPSGSSQNHIGENGVGLKQGCATLASLSFCLVKSNSNQYSLGVIAQSLQTNEACYLPSVELQTSSCDSVMRQEMIRAFTKEQLDIGECVQQYGGGDLERGIDRLLKHFKGMSRHGWEDYPHVFGLILFNLKHGERKRFHSARQQEVHEQVDAESQHHRVMMLFLNLREDLPRRYLRVSPALDLQVGEKRINFNYWKPRLVVMAQFDLHIDKERHFFEDKFWKNPHERTNDTEAAKGSEPALKSASAVEPSSNPSAYTMRIYMGFDATRVANEAKGDAHLYIYSRQSGRLIRKNESARGELSLASGGTDYCQGLTILVDDVGGNLPLNPTKQDVAFGEQANGDIHKRNLYAHISAAVKQFYMYYRNKECDKSKRILSDRLNRAIPDIQAQIKESEASFRPLSECEFDVFSNYLGTICQQSIRLLATKSVHLIPGRDTTLRLPAIDLVASMPKVRMSIEASSDESVDSDRVKNKRKRKSLPTAATANRINGGNVGAKRKSTGASPPKAVKGTSPQGRESAAIAGVMKEFGRVGKRSKGEKRPFFGGEQQHQQQHSPTEIARLKAELAAKARNEASYEAIIEAKDEELNQLQATIASLRQEIRELKQKTSSSNSNPTAVDKQLQRMKAKLSIIQQDNEDLQKQVQAQAETIDRKNKLISKQSLLIEQYEGNDSGLEV